MRFFIVAVLGAMFVASGSPVVAQSGQADLEIDAPGAPAVVVGDLLTYTVTVVNRGPQEVSAARVTVAFPPGLATGIPWTCTALGAARCTPSGVGDIEHSVSLPVGGSLVYRAVQVAGTDLCGRLSAEARVEAPAGANDPDPTDNAVIATRTVLPAAGICATKRLTSGVPEGSTGLSYEIQLVSNLSPEPLGIGGTLPLASGSDDATGPTLPAGFVDRLPPGTRLLNAIGHRGHFLADPTRALWLEENLGIRDFVILGLEVDISPRLAGDEVCNQGVFLLGDLVVLTDDPAQPGDQDPTCIETTVSIQDIPTLGDLALLLLALALAGLGALRLGAR